MNSSRYRKNEIGGYLVYGNLFDQMPDCGIDFEEIDELAFNFDFMTLTRSEKNLDVDFYDLKKANQVPPLPLLLPKPSTKPASSSNSPIQIQKKRPSIRDDAEDENVNYDNKIPGKGFCEKKRKLLNLPTDLQIHMTRT